MARAVLRQIPRHCWRRTTLWLPQTPTGWSSLSTTKTIGSFCCSSMAAACAKEEFHNENVKNAPEQQQQSVVDFSEYLLKRCDWKEAPKCPDYVGPVEVRLTGDGRGRGLFASQSVRAGALLLISNPVAISYDDPYTIMLLSKLVDIARENPSIRCRMYALGSTSTQTHLPVPPMELLTSTCLPPHITSSGDAVDEKRIMDIMILNYFSGETTSKPSTRFCGLWLIPSLINHSCIRNASRLMVGKAMVVYAARDIQAGEEITISYVNLMTPLQNREESYLARRFAFSCICRRCVLERSLKHCLADASERFYALHSKANDEVHSAMCTLEPLPMESFPACMELAGVYDCVRNKLSSMCELSKLEQQMVLAGYSSAFMGKWLVTGYTTRFANKSDFVNSMALEVVEAKRAAVPGLLSTLSFTNTLALLAHTIVNNHDMANKLLQLAMDECIRVYGRQKPEVLSELLKRSWEVVPFS